MIDGHQHFWEPGEQRPRWIGADLALLDDRFAPDVLEPLLSRNGIASSIAVQADRSVQDSDYLLSVAAEVDWVSAVVVWLDLRSVHRSRQQLAQLSGHSKLRGVREPLSEASAPGWLRRSETLRSIELVEDRGLLLEVAPVFPEQLLDIVAIAARFPHLTIVVDHLGKPPLGTSAMRTWESQLQMLGEHPNVNAKISGLNTVVQDSRWSAATLAPALEAAARAFDPTRLMAGSDWPVCLLNGSYSKVWETTKQLVQCIFHGSEHLVMGETARRVYQLAA